MKKSIAMLLSISLLLIMSACSPKQPSAKIQDSTTSKAEMSTGSITSEEENTNSQAEQTRQPKTSSDSATELTKQQKEKEPMKQAQFYITVQSTTFTANFADNESANAFRNLLREGDLTINMSDYGGFEKVGSIGKSLPRKDTHISTTAGDVVLYQDNQIVIFYGTNSWSYSRLGKIEGVTSEALLSAFGNGDTTITFSLTRPK